MSLEGKPLKSAYKSILRVNDNTNGIDSSAEVVTDGQGNKSALSLSDDNVIIQPQDDDNAIAFRVLNKATSQALLTVNTSGNDVRIGTTQSFGNTQYAYFGIAAIDGVWATSSDDTHYAIPFNSVGYNAQAVVSMGTATSSSFNDTEPGSTLTIATTADDVVLAYWYLCDDIYIDEVKWFHAGDAATGSSVCAYLMSYTVDTGNGSTSGDLSSGTKLFSSGTVTNSGYEQIHYNSMSAHSQSVDAGKVIIFTFAFDDTEATDYSINATVKYHLR